MLIPHERIDRMILLIRGQRVILDADLAEMYGVENKALKRQVRRNIGRFPDDFCFSLTPEEVARLKVARSEGRHRAGRSQAVAPHRVQPPLDLRCRIGTSSWHWIADPEPHSRGLRLGWHFEPARCRASHPARQRP